MARYARQRLQKRPRPSPRIAAGLRAHPSRAGEVRYALGHRLVDPYLEFVAGRCRPNTLRAVACDLKPSLALVARDPAEVTAADVFDFSADQRAPRIQAGRTGRTARGTCRPPCLCGERGRALADRNVWHSAQSIREV